jgi:hypothetical protein
MIVMVMMIMVIMVIVMLAVVLYLMRTGTKPIYKFFEGSVGSKLSD